MTIRVANVVMESRFGGPQNRILQVAQGLRRVGVETTVVMSAANSTHYCRQLAKAQVPHRRVRVHPLGRSLPRILSWFLQMAPDIFALAKTLRRTRADLVHCNGVWNPKPILAATLARKKIVLHLNDTVTGSLPGLLLRSVGPLCDGFACAGRRVLAVTDIDKLFPQKIIHILDAPVDVARFDPAAVEAHPLLSSWSRPRIVAIANVNPAKGLLILAKAAKIIFKQNPNATVHVVGSVFRSQEEYFAQVREMISLGDPSRFVFHGRSSNINAVLKAADIYICSSTTEASPMSVWEAMAMAKPVVSTAVGDVPRYIEDGVNGFVVPVGDVNRLADRVLHLIRDPALRDRFGVAARKTAVEKLDVQQCVLKHKALYEAVLATSH